MNLVKPIDGFLQAIRDVCDEHGSVFIIDEVMTGFRVGLGGAQAHYGVTPDLTTLGKIIGAGLPVGAFGGKREVMECIAPLGNVYQAGTLSGNPLAMRAGIEMFKHLREPGFYEKLTAQLENFLQVYRQLRMKPVFHSRPSKWAVCLACTSRIRKTSPALIQC